MKLLLKNGTVINVFTGEAEKADVLIEDGIILGVGQYNGEKADAERDVSGKYICPGFIDGHIHIESTFLTPPEFARAVLPHGTTTVIADPHEIANVAGKEGIQYMLDAAKSTPLSVYIMLPSCVPATPFCVSGASLSAEDLAPFYENEQVLGLGEVMNYVGVIGKDADLLQKIEDAAQRGKLINGHAPLLSGVALDTYIAAGIRDDHECSSAEEGKERIRKGQRVMIRQGTAAQNLLDMLPLFEEPWQSRCLLVSDDKHPADILKNGHIDESVRLAVRGGKSAVTAIRMATLWAAEAFGLRDVGAVAPGYKADILVLDGLSSPNVTAVYKNGVLVAEDGKAVFKTEGKTVCPDSILHSFHMNLLTKEDFILPESGRKKARVIGIRPGSLLTDALIKELDFSKRNGIDTENDILKIAVVERHNNTNQKGVGFLSGLGLQKGAIASSVSHDSHNLIIIGTNEADMAAAGNRILALGGGLVSVLDGKVLQEMPLPIGGIMTEENAETAAMQNEAVRESVKLLGAGDEAEPFMTMAFASLAVIPHLKLTTHGLVDVEKQAVVPTILSEE